MRRPLALAALIAIVALVGVGLTGCSSVPSHQSKAATRPVVSASPIHVTLHVEDSMVAGRPYPASLTIANASETTVTVSNRFSPLTILDATGTIIGSDPPSSLNQRRAIHGGVFAFRKLGPGESVTWPRDLKFAEPGDYQLVPHIYVNGDTSASPAQRVQIR